MFATIPRCTGILRGSTFVSVQLQEPLLGTYCQGHALGMRHISIHSQPNGLRNSNGRGHSGPRVPTRPSLLSKNSNTKKFSKILSECARCLDSGRNASWDWHLSSRLFKKRTIESPPGAKIATCRVESGVPWFFKVSSSMGSYIDIYNKSTSPRSKQPLPTSGQRLWRRTARVDATMGNHIPAALDARCPQT